MDYENMRTEIFPETTLQYAKPNTQIYYNIKCSGFYPILDNKVQLSCLYELKIGTTYSVMIGNDGRYENIAYEITTDSGERYKCIGNKKYFGQDDTGEPYIITIPYDGGYGVLTFIDNTTDEELLLEVSEVSEEVAPDQWFVGLGWFHFYVHSGFAVGQRYVITIDGISYNCISEYGSSIGFADELELIVFRDADALANGNNSIFTALSAKSNNTAMVFSYDGLDGVRPEECTIKIEQVGYTSNHYKYFLFRRLQRSFSMSKPADRYYTQNFFGKLFDESVYVTETAYNEFNKIMDDQNQYCFDNNIYYTYHITEEAVAEFQPSLTQAFAAIDIGFTTEIIKTSDGSITGCDVIFTKPNEEVMVYSVRDTTNDFTINHATRMEYNYAKQSSFFYNFEDTSISDLNAFNPMTAGKGTYWSYNEGTSTMTVTGDGVFYSCPTDSQVGGGDFTAVILGSNVSKIATNALHVSTLETIVLLHAKDTELLLDSGIFGETPAVSTLNIYCDNDDFRNYNNFPSDLQINWYTLTEWPG